MPDDIDYTALWRAVLRLPHHREEHSIHGPDHWLRVERNACILAHRTGACIEVVRLFALFHDSRRINDWTDSGHGERGAQLAAELRGSLYDLSDENFEVLQYACTWHTEGHHHEDPTIGTCWDADRLDIGRAGISPDAAFMSTEFGREIATHGTVMPWLELARPHVADSEHHHLTWQSFRNPGE
ncbi:MAG: hypothetical protein P1U87_08595 [Verrucomicrobiales bacterium]|nr:hypothetical protein [Verrucomicrobiales bacterium]